jgi:hypothetical protein
MGTSSVNFWGVQAYKNMRNTDVQTSRAVQRPLMGFIRYPPLQSDFKKMQACTLYSFKIRRGSKPVKLARKEDIR